MADGTVAFVIHAHLPWLREPAHEDSVAERWLFAAITETCVPLLEMLDALERDRVPVRFTLALSPTLLGMLADPLLQARYLRHLDRLVELAEKETRRTRADARTHALAEGHLRRFTRTRSLFLDTWQRDVVSAVRAYRDAGLIDVIPSAASHGLLPLLGSPAAVRAQVEVAAAEYRRHFGDDADGFWLPECAWVPGLDAALARAGFRWMVVDTHAIAHATPRPVHGVYAPIACDAGVAAFGRDPDAVRQVAGPGDGYPADPWYRDPARDVGLDLDADYVGPYLPPEAPRMPTGIRYHRLGGGDGEQEPYEPARARERVDVHAAGFVEARLRQMEWLRRSMDRPPIVVCAFDAALFGQRWFEGPQWLEAVLRALAASPALAAATPGDDLARHSRLQRATPGASSWGWNGYAESWLCPETDGVYRHLHAAAERLHRLCRRYPSADERTRRALTQALRELLIAQSSDWLLLLARPATAAYAAGRIDVHLGHCARLCAEAETDAIDDLRLSALEDAHNPFPALDYRVLL